MGTLISFGADLIPPPDLSTTVKL